MKFERLPSIADPDSFPVQIKPRHRLQVVPLADDLVAAFFDAPPDDAGVATSQLAAWSGDEALCRPLLGSRLIRRDGGLRYVFFLARSSRELCRKGLWITLRRQAGRRDRPVRSAVARGRCAGARRRAFAGGRAPPVARAPDHRAVAVRRPGLPRHPRYRAATAGAAGAAAARAARLVPAGQDGGDRELHAAQGPSRSARSATWSRSQARPRTCMAGARGRFRDPATATACCTCSCRKGMSPGTTLVALSETPLRLAGPSPTQRQRPLGPWLARRSPQIRRRTRTRLDRARRPG